MKKILVSGLVAMGLAALSGCGDENGSANGSSSGSSYSGTYEYEVNGCNTGRHQYGSKAELCRMLSDNSLNNNCAYSLRNNEYNEKCAERTAKQNSAPVQSAQSVGSQDVPVSYHPNVAQSRSAESPQEVVVYGQLAPGLQVQSSQSVGSAMSTLSGSFQVAVQNDAGFQIDLTTSNSAEFSGMAGNCTLSVANFSTIRSGVATVQFMLIGIDPPSRITSENNCASILGHYAKHGFQVRFTGAAVSTPAQGMSRANVSLSVVTSY